MSIAKIITLLLFTLFQTFVDTLVLVIKLVGIAQTITTKQPVKAIVWFCTLTLIYYLDSCLNVFM